MATFMRFEDIEAWQLSRKLLTILYDISRNSGLGKDYALRDQITRAALSIMSNIAEGYERDSPREFIHFLTIAKGSAGEVRSQLYVVFDAGYITQEVFSDLYEQIVQIIVKLSHLSSYLKSTLND